MDGEKIEPEKIADAFIGISLSKGEHRIEMKYCPEGFIPGLILTCAAGILFVLMYLKEKRDMNRRKNPENIQA